MLDAQEAETIFGDGFVKRDTPLYAFASLLYDSLNFLKRQLSLREMSFFLTGALDAEPVMYPSKWDEE